MPGLEKRPLLLFVSITTRRTACSENCCRKSSESAQSVAARRHARTLLHHWQKGETRRDMFVRWSPDCGCSVGFNGDRQLCVSFSLPDLVLTLTFKCFYLPQARPWRAFTAWRGKAWHRWRRWCSAWARPPSPSSYPSRGSWPRCEENPWRGESGQTEPGRDFRPAFMEGHEAQVLWTFWGPDPG